jgi:transcriptional regulator with XRE-family HTH domain
MTHDFEEHYLSPDSIGNLAGRVRRIRNLSQEEVASRLGIAQSNVSEAENHPERRPGTAIRIIESLSGLRFEKEPRYKIKDPNRDLTGERFESLAYHLRILSYLHFSPRSLADIRDQFPGYSSEGSRYIETSEMHLRIGDLSRGATIALEDLLSEGLIKFDAFKVTSRKERRNQFREEMQNPEEERLGYFGEQTKRTMENAADLDLASRWEKQDSECWYEDSGRKVDLGGKWISCFLSLSEDGETIIKKMGGIPNRLRTRNGGVETSS